MYSVLCPPYSVSRAAIWYRSPTWPCSIVYTLQYLVQCARFSTPVKRKKKNAFWLNIWFTQFYLNLNFGHSLRTFPQNSNSQFERWRKKLLFQVWSLVQSAHFSLKICSVYSTIGSQIITKIRMCKTHPVLSLHTMNTIYSVFIRECSKMGSKENTICYPYRIENTVCFAHSV